RSKEITSLLTFVEMYAETKPVFDQLNEIKFKKRREKFKAEHENELRRFYLARRKLKEHFNEDGKLPISAWRRELARLEQTVSGIKAEHLPLRQEWKQLNRVKTCVSNTLQQMGQTSHKRRDMER
ncbi:MAG: mobilization protein, partial [Oscillospiraceae bacterium]|nr:mobilization protein [Oscillospiraceae bacterium]